MSRHVRKKTFLPRICFETNSSIFKTFVLVCLFCLIGLLVTSIYHDSQSLPNLKEHLLAAQSINHHDENVINKQLLLQDKKVIHLNNNKENQQPPPPKVVQDKEKLVDRLNKQSIKVHDDDEIQQVINNSYKIRSPEKTFPSLSFETTLQNYFPGEGLLSKELKDIAAKCSSKNFPLTHPINYDSSAFVIPESTICNGHIYLLIGVHSYTGHKSRRELIRRTWGSFRQIDSHRVLIVFFVGRKEGETETERSILSDESNIYRDIVQRDFIENYHNITHKHVTIMQWLSLYCSKAEYLLKVDDDTFVDVFHVIHFLKMYPLDGFICKSVITKPVRDKKSSMSKWFVTKEEFGGDVYPNYCEGFGYIMRAKHARQLYWCSIYSKFFWIDDVFVTGILRSKLKINIEKFWAGHSWDNMLPSYASEKIADIMLLVASHNEIIPELWDSVWKSILRFNIL